MSHFALFALELVAQFTLTTDRVPIKWTADRLNMQSGVLLHLELEIFEELKTV
jgi:hypothetical protein